MLKINAYIFVEPREPVEDLEEAGEEICQVMNDGLPTVLANFPAADVIDAGVANFEIASDEEIKERGLDE